MVGTSARSGAASAVAAITAAPLPERLERLSLRSNFLWSLCGNCVYALSQWGMIVALAKWTNPFAVGQFSLGLAIAAPVLMFTNLQLRMVQASDPRRLYSFAEYLGLRAVTAAIAIAAIAGVALLGNYGRGTGRVIFAVAVAKGVEALSDLFYGLFQLNEHLDQVGKSMMLKAAVSLAGLCGGLWLGGTMLWAVAGLAAGWVALLILFDASRARLFLYACDSPSSGTSGRLGALRPAFSFRRQLTLARTALPLGIVMTLITLNLHVPRYFVEGYMGEANLGAFSAVAYTTVVVAMVADALGNSAVPRLSSLFAAQQIAAFVSVLWKLIGAVTLLAATGVVVTALIGDRLLALCFGAHYSAYAAEFTWLTAAAGLGGIASVLTCGITSARSFRVQVPIFALAVAADAAACWLLVPRRGLQGAAEGALIAALVQVFLSAAVLVYLTWKAGANPTGAGVQPATLRLGRP